MTGLVAPVDVQRGPVDGPRFRQRRQRVRGVAVGADRGFIGTLRVVRYVSVRLDLLAAWHLIGRGPGHELLQRPVTVETRLPLRRRGLRRDDSRRPRQPGRRHRNHTVGAQRREARQNPDTNGLKLSSHVPRCPGTRLCRRPIRVHGTAGFNRRGIPLSVRESPRCGHRTPAPNAGLTWALAVGRFGRPFAMVRGRTAGDLPLREEEQL